MYCLENAAGEVWVLRETLGGERLFSEFPKSALMTRESVMEDEKLCDAVNRHSSLSPAQVSFLTVLVCYLSVTVPVAGFVCIVQCDKAISFYSIFYWVWTKLNILCSWLNLALKSEHTYVDVVSSLFLYYCSGFLLFIGSPILINNF